MESTRRLRYPPVLPSVYVSNRIKNTKYTFLNFIPKNLKIQFGRFMNIFFLMIAVLQLIPTLTPVNPVTIWLPLGIIFTISMAKEGLDDYFRAKDDKNANERLVQVYDVDDRIFMIKNSQDIVVGDIIRVVDDEEFPCDIVILKSSNDNNTCFIQTSNLDGESDFKPRRTCYNNLNDIYSKNFLINCSLPNSAIYEFDGSITMDNDDVPLSTDNLGLQGTFLKNTDFIEGIAVYTGDETKVGNNKSVAPTKWSKIDRLIDQLTLQIFVILFILVIIFGFLGNYWIRTEGIHANYLNFSEGYNGFMGIIVFPVRFLLLLSMMIPISLKLTLEMIKLSYSLFISWDIHMTGNGEHAKARNTNICEELGQIEYILSDKTGTLTENEMVFKKCSIDGIIYGDEYYESALNDDSLLRSLNSEEEKTILFIKNMALCHTLEPIVKSNEIHWHGASLDEEALVTGASRLGFELKDKVNDVISLYTAHNHVIEEYLILNILHFTSNRKRMSIILRNLETDQIILLTKGADEVILNKCSNNKIISQTETDIERFSRSGLRTLVLAYKIIDEDEYLEWSSSFRRASISVNNKKEQLSASYELIEKDLSLLGVAAIEDKIQFGVPKVIRNFRKAGIKIWMLTGDKLTTAEQIAKSTKLIQNDYVISLASSNKAPMETLDDIYEELTTSDLLNITFSLLIDGSTLSHIISSPKFLRLALEAKTVVCARVTPEQKAQIVTLLKNQNVITLAIGDGGNDVPMIQAAHCGVGVAGREGRQASRAGDFSISRFEHLQRLVLVHGRYSYIRTAYVAHYCFYKSLFIAFMELYFAFYSGFSGAAFFNSFSLAGYNTFFTSLPILFYVLDKDISEYLLIKNPQYYRHTKDGHFMNAKTILLWFLRAAIQSSILFWFSLRIYDVDWINNLDGSPIDFDTLSMVSYTSAIIVNTFTIFYDSQTISFLNGIIIFGNLGLYFISLTFANIFGFMPEVMFRLFSNYDFWMTILLISVIALIPVSVGHYAKKRYYHSDDKIELKNWERVNSYLMISGGSDDD